MPQPPVGIDLGTTYSALAAINPAGRPEIVPNGDGDRLTASAILFEEGGKVIVGEAAVDAAGGYPDRVVRWIKSRMGSPEWAFEVDGREYSAVELSAMVLRKLKQDAERTFGPIECAVVTVPAYFDELRRRATIEAGKLAGLEVLRIINEPTAAAIAHASLGGSPGTVLVYDFGGGTCDASIVRVAGELEVEVIGSDGDHDLGGRHLDQELAGLYNRRLKAAKGVQVPEESTCGDFQRLITQAEADKRTLSKRSAVRGAVQWGGHLVNVDVTREAFEDLVKSYVLRTRMLVENVLADADLRPEDIDDVLLVGGSTRVPAVQRMLTELFGRAPAARINPDESVALGAAIQAGSIMQQRGLGKLEGEAARRMAMTRIRDVAPHSFGTVAVEYVYGVERLRNTIMIRKNKPLPTTRKETFYTVWPNQEAIDCTITQGEDSDPNFVRKIVQGELLELPKGLRAHSPIEVEYTYDLDGCMSCTFTEPGSGRGRTFHLSPEQLGVRRREDAGGPVAFEDLTIE